MICQCSKRFISFVDPLDPFFIHSVKVLQKTRPNISTAEIASLLNIDESIAIEIRQNLSKPTIANKAWWKFW